MRASRTLTPRAFNPFGWRLAHRRPAVDAKPWPNVLIKARSPGEEDLATGRKTWINTFRARSDKVIAVGRIMLAIGSLCIAWLDSMHPLGSPKLIFALLIAYLSYAVIAAIGVWRTEISRVRGTLIRHVVDVVALVVFMFLTDGASSPFFMFMPFTLLAATLHWRWQGALWTGLVCVAVLLYLMAVDTTVLVDPDFRRYGGCVADHVHDRGGHSPDLVGELTKRRSAPSCCDWSKEHLRRLRGATGLPS